MEQFMQRSLVAEPFHSRSLIKKLWGHSWGISTDVGPLRKVLMHCPGKEINSLAQQSKNIEAGSIFNHDIHGSLPDNPKSSKQINVTLLQKQHEAFVKCLQKENVDVCFLDNELTSFWPERMFTRDLGVVIPGGAVVARLALYVRYGETTLAMQTFIREGMPILGTIQGYGFVEGGSFTMIDKHTAFIGRSERVNTNGIDQLRALLALQGIDLITVDLPSTIIHLDEAFLLIDSKKALINKALLPFWFIDELHKQKFELFHVDPKDPPLVINGLQLGPGKVMIPSSGERTIELLQKNRIDVIPVDVSEFERLGGALHCLTLPLMRDDVF